MRRIATFSGVHDVSKTSDILRFGLLRRLMPKGAISNISPISFTTRYSPALSPFDNNEESHCYSKPDEACRYERVLITHVKPRGDSISLQQHASNVEVK
jgi:hypothetical protein